MKFGTKLKLKREWRVGIIDFEVGDIFYVANYIHKKGIQLKHTSVANLIDFKFLCNERDAKIDEYFEVLSSDSELIEEYKQMMFESNTKAQNMVSELRLKIDELKENDRLAELEKLVLNYYLLKGYKLSSDQKEYDPSWYFEVQIKTWNKKKSLNVIMFISTIPIMKDSYFGAEYTTTKEMFDKAFEFFDTKKHLCSTCEYAWSYPYCNSTIQKFGDGDGLDNIILCDGYSKEDESQQRKNLVIGQYIEEKGE